MSFERFAKDPWRDLAREEDRLLATGILGSLALRKKPEGLPRIDGQEIDDWRYNNMNIQPVKEANEVPENKILEDLLVTQGIRDGKVVAIHRHGTHNPYDWKLEDGAGSTIEESSTTPGAIVPFVRHNEGTTNNPPINVA